MLRNMTIDGKNSFLATTLSSIGKRFGDAFFCQESFSDQEGCRSAQNAKIVR